MFLPLPMVLFLPSLFKKGLSIMLGLDRMMVLEDKGRS